VRRQHAALHAAAAVVLDDCRQCCRLLDYYGSGPEWHIHYLWPMKAMIIRNPHAWEFYSWQNMLAFALFLLWTICIGWKKKRTPLEIIMPSLDAQLAGRNVNSAVGG